jgi:hypothetical protein
MLISVKKIKKMTSEEIIEALLNYPQFEKEISDINQSFDKEINKWNHPAKLVVLGEAPLSWSEYFYNDNPGNFLSLLKDVLKYDGSKSYIDFLREKQILVLDIYQYPIPSAMYNAVKKNALYDENFFSNNLNKLKLRNIIDDHTKFVFRYKKLIKRKLSELPLFSELNYLPGEPEPIGTNHRAATLNEKLEQDLNILLNAS